jgi:ABC-type lipoprotein release transport system permease subunit
MFYPRESRIGRPIVIAGDTWTIIGVVHDIVERRLDAPRGAFAYVPMAFNTGRMSVVVRTAVAPMSLVATMRREIERLDPGVALATPRTLDDAMAESMLQRKVVLALIAAFAFAALVLAMIGLYGVMAYAVATRQREFGIRTFGAVRHDLVGHVLGGGLRMMAVGLAIGLAGALGAARLLSSQLFHVDGGDPAVLVAVTLTVVVVAALACAVPAWRASRYDAVVTLRAEG